MSCATGYSIGAVALVIDFLGIVPATVSVMSFAGFKAYKSPKLFNILAFISIALLGIPNTVFVIFDVFVTIMGEHRPADAYRACSYVVAFGYLAGGPILACCVVLTFEKGFRSQLPKTSRLAALSLSAVTLLSGVVGIVVVAFGGSNNAGGLALGRIMVSISAFLVTSVQGFVCICSLILLFRIRKRSSAVSPAILSSPCVQNGHDFDDGSSRPPIMVKSPSGLDERISGHDDHLTVPQPQRSRKPSVSSTTTTSTFPVRLSVAVRPEPERLDDRLRRPSEARSENRATISFLFVAASSWRHLSLKMAILLFIMVFLDFAGFILLLGFTGDRWQASATLFAYAVYLAALLLFLGCIGEASNFIRPQNQNPTNIDRTRGWINSQA
ncbi:hypothetical protein BJ742DRAFT_835858 [Cladochytrium replicatum]|nr:hypothetical protein BJ742DRAFT_835858 [Cladochytrium replicatum]